MGILLTGKGGVSATPASLMEVFKNVNTIRAETFSESLLTLQCLPQCLAHSEDSVNVTGGSGSSVLMNYYQIISTAFPTYKQTLKENSHHCH